jgi:hypothetical protein
MKTARRRTPSDCSQSDDFKVLQIFALSQSVSAFEMKTTLKGVDARGQRAK